MSYSSHMPWSARVVLGINANYRDALQTLKGLFSGKVSTLMTLLMLGLSLSLPASIHIITKNLKLFDFLKQDAAQIHLFIKKETHDKLIRDLKNKLGQNSQVSQVEWVTKTQAIDDLKRYAGLDDALSYLETNPLPDVLIVHPKRTMRSVDEVSQLMSELAQIPTVDKARLNMQWLIETQRAFDIMYVILYTLSLLLLGIVTLVIHSTIRLSIHHQAHTIRVMKLVGATDQFIQRPFLYTGVWYGFLASLIAWCTVNILGLMVEALINDTWGFATIDLKMLNHVECFTLFCAASFLGWIASYSSVRRHLKQIEPE